MSSWHVRYNFPVTFETGPIICFDPAFDNLFIRISVYDELDPFLNNIHAQRGKFWISGPLGGFGKSTMLHYIARALYFNIHKWKALPFHISVGKKTPTVEDTFYRSFIDQFLKLPENLSKAKETLRVALPNDVQKHVLNWFKESGKREIRRIRKEMADLKVGELERRFNLVMEEVLSHWASLGIFSKYVLLIDEMDKLDTDDVLTFLSGNQDLFQKLYQEYQFVVFVSGHSSWIERILDGTEYTYYHGKPFRIPPFKDISEIKRLVETRLLQYLHMIPSDNPWTNEGYDELREMSGGVPRIIIELAELAINEAQHRNIAKIGPGILKEIIVTEKSIKPIEDYFRSHLESFIKLKAAVEKHVDSLLYIFYDMPGHRIPKEYDESLTARTRYLGIELSDEAWIEQVRTLVNLECISDEPRARNRELTRDLCDLFDKLSEHPALIQKVVPTIIKKLGKLKPKFPSAKAKPPDFQKIIETSLRARARKRWFSKEDLFQWFLNSTRTQLYLRACKIKGDPEEFVKRIFEKEFRRYVKETTPSLMIFKEANQFYYRNLPEEMKESEYSTLKVFQSRELVDSYIDLVISPSEFGSKSVKRLDQLIETMLSVLAEERKVQFERGCLRKKSRDKIFNELGLNSTLRRRLRFYIGESKGEPRDRDIIQETSRYIITDLAKEYEYATTRGREIEVINVRDMIEKGENERMECKSSMCWDYKENRRNKLLEFAVAKTVSAFMNSEGGYLFIGIGDDKQILGVDKDMSVIKKPDKDGFELHFTGVIKKYLGKENRQYSKLFFETIDTKDIAIVKVEKSPRPVYTKSPERKEEEFFFVRLGNSSQPLGIREAAEYIKTHWK